MKAARLATLSIVAFSLLLQLGFSSTNAIAQNPDEASAIKAKYDKLLAKYSYIAMHPTNKSPGSTEFSTKNNMVSKELKGLLIKDEECAKKSGEICNLDFDFLFNAQDTCNPLHIISVVASGNTYIMKVSNRCNEVDKQGYYKPYDFTLIQESGEWVIDDAVYTYKNDKGKIAQLTLKGVLNGKGN